MKLFFYFLIIFLFFSLTINIIISVYAQVEDKAEEQLSSPPEIPSIPMFVKGIVYINDKPAPSGEIQAKINDELKAKTTISNGEFAFPVAGQSKDYNQPIEFYVNNQLVNTTLPWQSGEIKEGVTFYLTKEEPLSLFKIIGIIALILMLLIIIIIIYLIIKKKKK